MFRKITFAVPFACVTAILTHFARFGEDHTFGGDANAALVSAALGGSAAIALVILHAFLTAGTTTSTGTVASSRARSLIPNSPTVFILGGALYYGIESLEGNGIEIGIPTLLLAALSLVVAFALRRGVELLAQFAADIARDWIALLDRRTRTVWHLSLNPQPLHSRVALGARRFGRAPPNGRRFH